MFRVSLLLFCIVVVLNLKYNKERIVVIYLGMYLCIFSFIKFEVNCGMIYEGFSMNNREVWIKEINNGDDYLKFVVR